MKKHWAAARDIYTQWVRNRALRHFHKLMADKKSGLENIIDQVVGKRACAMCMNWLDNKRVLHCRFCPNTEQLRKHMDYLLCMPHYDALVAQPSKNGHKEKVNA